MHLLSSFCTSIIEDLIERIHWFNHSALHIDFYGDMLSVKLNIPSNRNIDIFIDITKYNLDTKKQLLEYALISCYKNNCYIITSEFRKIWFDKNIIIAQKMIKIINECESIDDTIKMFETKYENCLNTLTNYKSKEDNYRKSKVYKA